MGAFAHVRSLLAPEEPMSTAPNDEIPARALVVTAHPDDVDFGAAGTVACAPMKWPIVTLLGVVIGFIMGTWTLVPAAVVGAVVARLIPRLVIE